MSWLKNLRDLGDSYLNYKAYEIYSNAWSSYKSGDFEQALNDLKRVPRKHFTSIENNSMGFPAIEVEAIEGLIYFGMGDYKKAKKLLEFPVSWAVDDCLENTNGSPIRIMELIPDIYYKYGLAYWRTGDTKKGVEYIIKAFNHEKNNLWYIIKIILIYASEDDLYSVDFYTESLCKCYNSNNDLHREQLHEILQNEKMWANFPQAFERYLRKLRSENIIDDHFFHSKIGISKGNNILSENNKSKLLKLVVNNEMPKVFDELLLQSSEKPDIFNQVIILFNNYNKMLTEIRAGVIDKADETLYLNKIKLSVIELIRDL